MKSFTVAALAGLAAVASALSGGNTTSFTNPTTGQTIRHFDCDVHQGTASKHFNETIKSLHLNSRRPVSGGSSASLVRRQVISPALNIKVYMHLVTTVAKKGQLTTDNANAQLTALNTAYTPVGITFTLANTTIDANDAWAVGDGTSMDDLKEARRQGTYQDLNLYFQSDLSGGVLGTCTLPSQVTKQTLPSQYFSDGCNINGETMPGRTMTGYNKGMTAVHETGHWLGLLHTFEGYACTGDGDSIADTPMQSTSTDGCPTKPVKDSCPDQTGVDAIHNYMDYSDDDCYTSFTPGQVTRIQNMWTTYRAGL